MRAALVEAVQDAPGIHLRGLQRAVDCSTSTINHHVRRTDRIDDATIRGYRRFYPRDIDVALYSPIAALNHDVRGPLLAAIDAADAPAFDHIVDHADRAPATVSHHLSVLADADLVMVQPDGRTKRYQLTAVTRDALARHGDSLLDRLADGFIAMWD